jgi:hypothetical protein
MSFKAVKYDMLKKFGEVQKTTGSTKGNKNNVIELCRLSLEKGYVYEVDTVISQNISNNNAINSYIYGDNCTVHYYKTIGIGVSGGGVTNRAIVTVNSDNATVKCATYVYDDSITYNGYIRARKIGII